jgi:hypothetical protein
MKKHCGLFLLEMFLLAFTIQSKKTTFETIKIIEIK